MSCLYSASPQRPPLAWLTIRSLMLVVSYLVGSHGGSGQVLHALPHLAQGCGPCGLPEGLGGHLVQAQPALQAPPLAPLLILFQGLRLQAVGLSSADGS